MDTETTGLDPTAEIVEISIVDAEGQVLLDSLVRPVKPIPLDAALIHGITNTMVEDAPAWPTVWAAAEAILRGRYIGIYNAEFDLRMMKQSHSRYDMLWDFPSQRVFDVMKLYADLIGAARWQTLDAAGRQCGVPLPNAHRAQADALLLRAVFHDIAARTP